MSVNQHENILQIILMFLLSLQLFCFSFYALKYSEQNVNKCSKIDKYDGLVNAAVVCIWPSSVLICSTYLEIY